MATQIPLNPLSAFFQGFQGAQTRAQQAEQQAVENELSKQLRQIQLLNAQRQLAEASKTPQQRLTEQLQEAIAVDALKRGALVQTPLNLAGENIALPSATSQTAAQLASTGTFSPALETTPLTLDTGVSEPQGLSEALSRVMIPGVDALESTQTPSFAIPSAPLRGIEEAIAGLPGFAVSEEAGRQKTAQDLTKLMQQEQIKAQFTRGNKKALGLTPDGKGVVVQDASTGDITVEAIPGGEGAGIIPLPTSRTGGAGGRTLTPNSRANILAKAGTAGITSEIIKSKYTDESGVVDYDRIILDSNQTIANDKSLAAQEKLKQIPPAERAKATGFIAAHKGLSRLIEEVNKLKVDGKEPGVWNRAVATALEAPPDGVFSALYQSSIGQSLTADEQSLNALKAMVRSAVTKANAGLSQTEREIANVSQYVPKSNDTLEETLRKGALLETYLIDQVESITTDPRDWLSNFKAGEDVNLPRGTNSTTPSAGGVTTKSGNKFQLAR